jgi:hypothetical protein
MHSICSILMKCTTLTGRVRVNKEMWGGPGIVEQITHLQADRNLVVS